METLGSIYNLLETLDRIKSFTSFVEKARWKPNGLLAGRLNHLS